MPRLDLFNIAKSVDDHCHSEQLSTATGRWECQQICHDHFCCFDTEYSCHEDESKLCRIFAGCEVLVLEDFVKPRHAGQDSSGGVVNHEIDVAATKEEELGWQEIREKYINVYCGDTNVKTKSGKKQCEKVCEHHFCCFDNSEDGKHNCQKDKSMTCDVYSACQVLTAETVDMTIYPDETIGLLSSGIENNGPPMPPDMAGDISTDPLLEEMNDSAIASGQYSSQELVEMKADVKQRCIDYQSPTGRLQCEKICKFNFCCFSEGEDSCTDNPAKLCGVYDVCVRCYHHRG